VVAALAAIVLAGQLGVGVASAKTGGAVAASTSTSVDTAKDPAYVPDTVLVGYRRGTTAGGKSAARRSVKATSAKALSPLSKDTEKLKLPPGSSVEDAILTLEKDPNVRFAEPDHIVSVDAVSNDPLYLNGSTWGMESGGSSPSNAFGSGARDAWTAGFTGSRSVVVGVVDEGIEIDHPDLAANIWTNPWEIPGNTIDDDGNGYVDDIHGWDFMHGDASVDDGPSVSGHGTHVAGTIGGVGGNGIGVAGVNWAVTMISAKFLEGTGDTSDAVAALDYITDLKIRHGLSIVATNDSWGGGSFDQALLDAINRGGDAGILFVSAAGNAGSNDDSTPFYPSSSACTRRFDTGQPRGWDCIVSVAAIDATGALAGFSNYGAATVDIGAPGAGIVSTYPPSNYKTLSGTSMATPHVTGAIALLQACNPALDPVQLRGHLLADGTLTPSLAGKTVTGRRLNIAAMTAACDTSPDVQPPVATITAPASPTKAATLTYVVSFDEPVTGLAAGDFSVTGTATGCAVGTPSSVTATSYRVGVGGCSNGTVILHLGSGTVHDVASNTGPTNQVNAASVTVDRTPPTVTLTAPPTPTAAASLSYSLHFNEPASGLNAIDFARAGTASGCTVGAPTGGGSNWTVAVTGCGSGTVVLALKAASVTDAAGNVGPNAQVTAPTVTVDHTGPVVTAPIATARAHAQVVGTSAPYQLVWTGSDASGVARYELQQSVNGAAYVSLSTMLTTPLANVGMAAGRTYRFRVHGIDRLGNAGAWVNGPTLTTALVQQTSASIHYGGSWATAVSSVYSAGSTRFSRADGASASYTFTGRSVALVSSFISGRGRVKLYIDGSYVTWIDLSTAPAMYRSIAWQRTWSASGSHTFRVVAMDATRPRIDLDAIATLR
jgi:subtilisin family serine protease